jgi:hypothetical protein
MRFLLYLSQNYSFEIMRPLAKVMFENGHAVKWFVDGKKVNQALFHDDEVVLDSVKATIAYQPDAVFLPGNVVPSFIPGLKVQLFHGFEWKKKGHFRIRECFDLYCTQGPFFTDKFLALRELHPHFSVVETGWTKLDTLFQMPRVKRASDEPAHILYAPTFSPSFGSATALLSQIVTLSHEQDWVWNIKFHPKMDPNVIAQYEAMQHDKLIVVKEASILPLLNSCDVMVSDTSSAITEFLLLNKPVVTFNNAQPEDVLINITEPHDLADALQKALSGDTQLNDAINTYRHMMHPYTDGQAAQRVLDATLAEINTFPRAENVAKPRNWLRNLKLRKRLNYWF